MIFQRRQLWGWTHSRHNNQVKSLTCKGQDVPLKSGNSVPQEAEISSDLAARIAFAEEAAREDRDRMVRNEHFVAFLAGFPPDQLGQLFNGFPPEGIVNFLKKIPELPELTTRWAEQYFEFLNRPDIGQDIERLESRGARKEPIAIAMIAIRFSPMFDNMFAQFGDKRERVQRAKRLLVPLPELSALASMFGDIPALLSRKMPNPSLIISDLKLLSALFELGEFTYDSLGANHLLE